MPLNPSWQYLSPLTLRVVRLMCREGWLSKDEIADSLEERREGKLVALLPDLAARKILESSTSKGYHIGIPETAEPETYRKQLLEWTDAQLRSMPGEGTG